jgi:hypothetical protein
MRPPQSTHSKRAGRRGGPLQESQTVARSDTNSKFFCGWRLTVVRLRDAVRPGDWWVEWWCNFGFDWLQPGFPVATPCFPKVCGANLTLEFAIPPLRFARYGRMISFIIPAHNEAVLIGRTLAALHQSAQAQGERYEVIVVNDASTDYTAECAREHGARVVDVNHRQIAATRNAGARSAAGDMFFFIDADTMATARAVRAAVRALRGGAVGGGCAVRFDGPVPLYAAIMERAVQPILLPLLRMAPGCFFYCTRQAFFNAGGFDEALFWGEEVALARRLKRQGRFVMLREFVITSGRKLRTHTALELLRVGIRLALGQRAALDYWYGPRTA